MNIWWRRLHILSTLGGGFLGFAVTLPQLFAPRAPSVFFYLILAFVLLFFAYGIFIGFKLAEGGERVRKHLIAYYLLQSLWVSSPTMIFRLASGFYVVLGVFGGRFTYSFGMGSEWQIVFNRMVPWGFAINVFALACAIILIVTSLLGRDKADASKDDRPREDVSRPPVPRPIPTGLR